MTGEPRHATSEVEICTWDSFLVQTLGFAIYQVRRRQWRFDDQGPLPEGYDPASIASQAIMEFLQQHPVFNSAAFPTDPADGEFMADLDSNSRKAIQYELNRLVLKQVNRLYHLKENFVMESVEDLIPIQDMDGEYVNPLDLIPAPDIKPDDALLEKESMVLADDTARQFELTLANRPLISLLRLGLEGVIKPAEIAHQLKIPARVVYNLRERLQRAWCRFSNRSQI